MARHKWHRDYGISEEGEEHLPYSMEVCLHCGCTREIIAIVGIRYHRALRSYLREDGVRFTGLAPECQPIKVPTRGPGLIGPLPYSMFNQAHTLNQYQEQANSFINEPQYSGEMDYLLNTALGLTGESGEFADIIKKIRFHGHPFTPELRIKLHKELGDILWYIAQGCKALEVSLEDVAYTNIVKLTDRHGGSKFSEQASLTKDESKEAVPDRIKAPHKVGCVCDDCLAEVF